MESVKLFENLLVEFLPHGMASLLELQPLQKWQCFLKDITMTFRSFDQCKVKTNSSTANIQMLMCLCQQRGTTQSIKYYRKRKSLKHNRYNIRGKTMNNLKTEKKIKV